MPWRVKRVFYLLAICFAMLALAVAVYVRNRSPDDVLLASIGILGGLAVAIAELLPKNGRRGE